LTFQWGKLLSLTFEAEKELLMRLTAELSVAMMVSLVALPVWSETPDPFAYRDAETVAHGAEIYSEYCAACHGDNLEGQQDWQVRDAHGYLPAPPHDESGHTWHHPTLLLFEITKYGTEAVVGGGYKSKMAGFGDVLSDSDIMAVLAYIKSTWPRHITEQHDQMDAVYNLGR
jgi:mono/diheme cytochrome c family protein